MPETLRKLAAIMFTDMVGYTALGQKDESLSVALVEAQQNVIRPVLARHGGREVKTMGDAFLVEFTNALEAVRCAYDIQRAVREFNLALASEKRIHLRVGIHLGDVEERQGDVFGDAVNVASRIEPLADDGGVCVTRQVYDFVKNKVDMPLSSLGPKSLKSVAEPMEVYRMVMPWEKEPVTSSMQLDRKRVAVLPLSNISPDPNDAYFADGMTEELITVLSQVQGLRVIARTSVDHYTGKDRRISQIARELEAGTVMEGSVRMAGDRIRVTVQLINGQNEEHLWSENYDRKLDDVFAIQSDIAKQVAQSLRVRLLESDRERLDSRGAESLSAYTTYLKGRALMRRRQASDLAEAKKLFELTISQDPTYAPAYAGLADAYNLMSAYFVIPTQIGKRKAWELASKAIQMDPIIAEPHATLANLLTDDYRFEESAQEFKKAIALNPSYANAHLWYSFCLGSLGRYNDALEQLRLAEEADPLSVIILSNEVIYFMVLGEEESSRRKLQKALEVDPDHFLLDDFHGFFYYLKGDYARAIEIFLRGVAVGENFKNPNYMVDLILAYAASGDTSNARKWMDELLALPENTSQRSLFISYAYAALGDVGEFFAWSDRAISEKYFNFGDVRLIDRVIPAMHNIRQDPRFNELFARVGLSS